MNYAWWVTLQSKGGLARSGKSEGPVVNLFPAAVVKHPAQMHICLLWTGGNALDVITEGGYGVALDYVVQIIYCRA